MARTRSSMRRKPNREQQSRKLNVKNTTQSPEIGGAHTDKNQRNLYCEPCNKTFSSISSLNAHQKKHGGRRWKCDFCNETFVSKHSYLRHVGRAHQCQNIGNIKTRADEHEVYVVDDHIQDLSNGAKRKLINRLTKEVDGQEKVIRQLRREVLKLKRKIKELRKSNSDFDLEDICAGDGELHSSSDESQRETEEEVSTDNSD